MKRFNYSLLKNHSTILLLVFSLLFLVLSLNPIEIFAAKKRIRIPKTTKYTGLSYSYAKLRGDRLGVNITFLNLGNVQNIIYILTYVGNGVDQGVRGTIAPLKEATATRELLFATCSKNICTWHNNIQNMKLMVTTTTKSGAVSTKIYRIKP